MKLVELLVQELPKRGGWPEHATQARQDEDGEVCFEPVTSADDFYPGVMSSDSAEWMEEMGRGTSDLYVTREEYEAALVKTAEWDGAGLPPVGTEIEVLSPSFGWKKAKVTAVTDNWIVAQYEDGAEFVGAHRILEPNGIFTTTTGMFRALKTKVERQREITTTDLKESLKGSGYEFQVRARQHYCRCHCTR